jgi:hypothetical protein
LIGAIEQYIQQQEHRLRVKLRSVRGRGSVGPGFDLPSKKSLRDAAKSKWGKARAGWGETNFNWHLGDGFVRIRFHHWPGFGEQLRRWFLRRLPGDVHLTGRSTMWSVATAGKYLVLIGVQIGEDAVGVKFVQDITMVPCQGDGGPRFGEQK